MKAVCHHGKKKKKKTKRRGDPLVEIPRDKDSSFCPRAVVECNQPPLINGQEANSSSSSVAEQNNNKKNNNSREIFNKLDVLPNLIEPRGDGFFAAGKRVLPRIDKNTYDDWQERERDGFTFDCTWGISMGHHHKPPRTFIVNRQSMVACSRFRFIKMPALCVEEDSILQMSLQSKYNTSSDICESNELWLLGAGDTI